MASARFDFDNNGASDGGSPFQTLAGGAGLIFPKPLKEQQVPTDVRVESLTRSRRRRRRRGPLEYQLAAGIKQ